MIFEQVGNSSNYSHDGIMDRRWNPSKFSCELMVGYSYTMDVDIAWMAFAWFCGSMGLEYDRYQLVLEALFVYMLNAVLLNGFKRFSLSLSGIESISYSVLTFGYHELGKQGP